MTNYKIKHKLIIICLMIFGMGITSCEDYLDHEPEAEITKEEIFTDFDSFQGFTEELYHTTPQYTVKAWVYDWHMADEIIATSQDWRFSTNIDRGNYWYWQNGWQSYFSDDGANTDNNSMNKSYYHLAWYGLRKANLGLENLDQLTGATQEERDFIEGQLLFFRGFLHFQLMTWWGGLPYIDEVLGTEALDLPRLSYQETAQRVAEDLEAAAELLPVEWDNTEVGRRTLGNNQQRITKSVAYAYLGKNHLYAASPLMNRESTGNPTFDEELCQKAAEAFYKTLHLSHVGGARYELLPWDRYMENFYTLDHQRTGGDELLLGSAPFYNNIWYNPLYSTWFPNNIGGDGNMISVAGNYVEYFGCDQGLPLDHADANYDPADPWRNRDPRFHKKIVVDGDTLIWDATEEHDDVRFANLYTGGNHRGDDLNCRSGYMFKKWQNMDGNNVDGVGQILFGSPYLRLADVYLMYAEAVLQGYGSPQSSYPETQDGFELTAVEAVNIVRDRAQLPGVHEDFLDSKEAFMDEIIRERAVELMSEANIRKVDLRRWLLLEEMQYREKYAIEFDRDTLDDGRIVPINLENRHIMTRVVEDRHYWFPFPTGEVNVYPEFYQNPGW